MARTVVLALSVVIAVFGDDDKTVELVSHVFALMEMAWHNCYAEITPSEDVVDDVLLCSGGTLEGLVNASSRRCRPPRSLALGS